MPVIPYVRATHSDGQSWSAAKANLLEAGCNDLSYAPCVRAYHNANQSLVTATWTPLALNSERIDQAGNAVDTMHDNTTFNSRLTCRYAGVYQITGHFEFAANATGQRFSQIWLNGGTIIAEGTGMDASAANQTQMTVSTIYQLSVNDYVQLYAWQNSGAGLNVTAVGNYSPEFMMHRIG
jgi:hypothetical protein